MTDRDGTELSTGAETTNSSPNGASGPNPAQPGGEQSLEAYGPRFREFVQSLERPVVFFDLETTGVDPVRDRVVEVSFLRVGPMPMGVEEARTWRVNPQMSIPGDSSAIHGIYDVDVAQCPSFADLAEEFLGVLTGADLGGFSISRFDIRVLLNEFNRCDRAFDMSGVRIVDPQVIFHRREPRDLSAALRYYCGREHEGAHGAKADTVASLDVFAGQLERYTDLSADIDEIHGISAAINSAYVDFARRFAWRDGEPVFNFGKLKGQTLRAVATDPKQRNYLRHIVGGTFEEDTKAVVREALDGKIRSAPGKQAAEK